MRIIGIDPGYDRLGIAILEKTNKNDLAGQNGKETLLHSACLQTSNKDLIHDRLLKIGAEISAVLTKFKPDEMAIENLFITKNQKTAMRVAEARGIIMYEAARYGIPIFEYTPMQIKLAVTGDGNSDKLRVAKMINLLIKIPVKSTTTKTVDDESDAIAVALTHSAMRR